jgi:hypothetical protein
MVAWKKSYEKGTVETNAGSSFQQCNKLVGDEIFLDTDTDSSYISLYFLNKWHNRNKDTEVIFNDSSYSSALTSIKIGGKTYPVFFKVVDGFAPMTLGQEFFRHHNWIMLLTLLFGELSRLVISYLLYLCFAVYLYISLGFLIIIWLCITAGYTVRFIYFVLVRQEI